MPRAAEEREAIAGQAVCHSDVVAVLDHGETRDGRPFIVLQRVAGEPLGEHVARAGALTPARAIAVTRNILGALAAVHDAGIVHADVKSDNVRIELGDNRPDRCKLIDLGETSMRSGSFSIDYVVRRALRKAPHERYTAARDFEAALARIDAPRQPAPSTRARHPDRRMETVVAHGRGGPELASNHQGLCATEDHRGGEPCGHVEPGNGGGRGS